MQSAKLGVKALPCKLGAVPRPGGIGPQTESMQANNTRLGDTRPRGDDAIIAIKACTSQPGQPGPAWCLGASLKHQASKPKIEERDGRYFGRDGHQTLSRSHMDQPPWLVMLPGQYNCIRRIT